MVESSEIPDEWLIGAKMIATNAEGFTQEVVYRTIIPAVSESAARNGAIVFAGLIIAASGGFWERWIVGDDDGIVVEKAYPTR